ncbi:MAG: ARMT1-like domain-containing protein [Candidatus Desulfofervidus auxilii]|nr:ARMT1-like domain-containing protein [Candidatus Desulfofervidus auxilii]
MRVYLECIPCFLRQALQAVCLATKDKAMQEKIMREILQMLHGISWNTSPPEIGWRVHHMVKEMTNNDDPYADLKRRFNELALALYPTLEEKLLHASNPFEIAVRLSLAGNMIDFGARPGETINVEEEIEKTLQEPLDKKTLEKFKKAVEKAKNILFLGDNAGEVVFDKFLIKQIGTEKITYAVKAKPIINDATLEDAKIAGLNGIVEVIDNGSDIPGTILEKCSENFIDAYKKADLVIAKGQGNYETLNDVDKPIAFLLKVKCRVVAKNMGRKEGELAIHLQNVYC